MINIDVFNNDATTNATNIKIAFDTYVTGYFSRVEVDTTSTSGSVYVNFYLEGSESPDMKIRLYTNATSSQYPTLTVGGSTFNLGTSTQQVYRINRIIVTDNGIAVQVTANGTMYSNHFVICKTDTGKIMAVFYATSNNIYYVGSNTTIDQAYQVTLSLSDKREYATKIRVENNNNGIVVGVPSVSLYAGASQNVYIPYSRCFAGISEAFKYQINGENYVGIGYNSIIIKSN